MPSISNISGAGPTGRVLQLPISTHGIRPSYVRGGVAEEGPGVRANVDITDIKLLAAVIASGDLQLDLHLANLQVAFACGSLHLSSALPRT